MHAGMDQSDRFDDGESDFCEQRSVGLIEKARAMARQALGCGHLLTMLPEASKALSARERVLLFCERGWIGCDQGTPWCRCAPRAAPRDRGQTYFGAAGDLEKSAPLVSRPEIVRSMLFTLKTPATASPSNFLRSP